VTTLPKLIQALPMQALRTPTQAVMEMHRAQPLAHAGAPIAPIVQDQTQTILDMPHLDMKPTWKVWRHQIHDTTEENSPSKMKLI